MKFSVVLLVCADLDRSSAFYRNVLGLKLVAENEAWANFQLGDGSTLSLHAKTELLAVRPGSLQLGFAVESVDTFVADCTQLGVPVFQDPYDEPFGRVAVIGDPDGYPIQISSSRKVRR
ncbi:MAG: VOC family protein [Candidatus Eremiobacteraeota bacterium]|nr:VOC family protein [Candidatus Eremiobacteraeota bacterium]